MRRGAILSADGLYRYQLWRYWDATLPILVFLMLNPSKADAKEDDPTILKCIKLAKHWGYGGIVVVNLFALRSTDSDLVRQLVTTDPHSLVVGPIGPENDAWIEKATARSPQYATGTSVVVAWGNFGWAASRAALILKSLLARGCLLFCLGRNANGSPKHPLARGKHRVPDNAPLLNW